MHSPDVWKIMMSITKTVSDTKCDNVKSWFEAPRKYLEHRRFDIRIRMETVREYVKDGEFDQALDIGCGDGSISLPLLDRLRRLTLLDISSNMLAIAKSNIPSESSGKVDLINADLLRADLKPGAFDLILCLGILAHVDSPGNVIKELSHLAKPGARVVLEFTDSYHFWSVPVILYQNLLKLRRPAPYALNRLRRGPILSLCRKAGLEPVRFYRYGHPPIGTGVFASQDEMYKMTRSMFGYSYRNGNRWMGNQFICLLEKRTCTTG
jgi:2-polyprenyl-3-methyl-5-hydroxy-6-metoxy-1,4-benzoquinol methylase